MPAAAANDGVAVDEGSAASATLAHFVLFASDVGSVVHKCLTIEALLALLLTCRAAKQAIAFTTLAEAVLAVRGAGEMVLSAVQRGDVRLLEWAIGSPQMPRWPWPEDLIPDATDERSSQPMVTVISTGLMFEAVAAGRLDVMKWLRAQHPPCDVNDFEEEQIMYVVGSDGDVRMAEWLCSQGLDITLCLPHAVRRGHLPMVRWVLEEKLVDERSLGTPGFMEYESEECMWKEAAANGHLHVLEWLRAQEPPYQWDEEACLAAASAGHIPRRDSAIGRVVPDPTDM